MSWTQEERQEIEEAAAILLRIADPLWTRPTDDSNDNDRVNPEENVDIGGDEGNEDDEEASVPVHSRQEPLL